MKVRRHARGGRLWLLLALLAVALAVVAAGCGGDEEAAPPAPPAEPAEPPAEEPPAEPPAEEPPAEEPPAEEPPAETTEEPGAPIKIGHLSNCEGPFGPFYGQTVGGFALPFINRGATPVDPADPAQGAENAVVAGHPIEFVYGCSDATPEKALEEARRLVEQEGVNILVGPLSGSEGIALANYSKDFPDVTFVNGTSGAQDTTLKVQSPNFFRFNTDGAQWAAGLGAYAYNVLGWRTAVTMGDDYDFPYTQVAGFVAEFCSLGGQVTQRLWPALGEEDYTSFIADIPEDVDGFFLAVGGTGTVAFVNQYTQLEGNLADDIMGGVFMTDPIIQQELGDRILGVVTAGSTSGDSQDPAYLEFIEQTNAAWPDFGVNAPSIFYFNNWANTEAIVQTIEAQGGYDDPAAFQAALATVALDTAFGPISLDENRQAIGNNYLQQLQDENGDGVIEVKTLATIEQVDQTFAGAFSADTPTPDRENPECVAGAPQPWTAAITPEALGTG
jgi:branched-chain amino acid transport system substrate-binding protein